MTRDASRPTPRLSSPTFSPLYRQIKDFLIRSLEEGEWGPGDAIPSEGELATRFNVSQGTVRKAIDEMAAENMLVRRQGKGTFVATHDDPRSFYRFLRLVPNDGRAAHAVSDPFFCETIEAAPEVAAVLGLQPGEKVVHVKRLLRFSGEPLVFDQIYLVADLFSGLTLEGGDEFGAHEVTKCQHDWCPVGRAAFARRANGLHLWQQAGGVATRVVFHAAALLPE